VEVIGWLYQFYISEKKDEVFEGLKKNKKITPENIPAATQLFTPHWIVRYLVENSLGRLWLLNRPNSKLAEQMDYYIAPQEPVTDYLRIAKPEDIKLCDPACGSGHMLTYAFDLLYAIYEEEGADPAEIPEKILTHNLYGIEIDERAAELAAFALTMKARGKQRRFLNKRIQPNICVLRPVKIAPQDLDAYVAEVGRDLFTANLRTLLTQFEEADNFGSLIRPVAMEYAEIRRVLAEKGIGNQLLLEHVHSDVLRVLEQAEYLSQRYQVVVANPPYMGGKGMNGRLGAWAKENYPDSKSDLFAMFIERNLDLVAKQGAIGMITMQSWMFLSSYEKLRANLLNNKTLTAMAHLGPRAFDSIGGEVVSTTAFVFENAPHRELKGDFLRLIDGSSETEKDRMIREAISNRDCGWHHRAASADFQRIPGQPIAYWVSESVRQAFQKGSAFGQISTPKQGLATGCNDLFLREWHEVSSRHIGFDLSSRAVAQKSGLRWFPYNKGGEWRKWYGNYEYVVDWEDDGLRIRDFKDADGKVRSRPQNTDYYFQEGITWADITTNSFAARYAAPGFIFDVKGSSGFPSTKDLNPVMGLMNSKLMHDFMLILNPTSTFQVGDMARVPYIYPGELTSDIANNVQKLIALGKQDWDSAETSWHFTVNPLADIANSQQKISGAYGSVYKCWLEMIQDMRRLEEENNRIFIEAYGLQNELTPDVPLSEITLTCNPHYRYGGEKSKQELEDLLRADTMREFISYAVGCMFGRYSLDKPGLILANQGETLEDYLRQVPEPRFTPDADNVIPLLDGDWFPDDITGRFREFLRVSFGDEHYDENLRFIESALGKKGKPLPIRDFFLKEFYTDHVKRYKKRPIYWLFSSPKGSFNALIYLHRYRPDTASIVLQYLRDFRSKLVSERDHQTQVSISTSASQGEKTKALKRIEELKKVLVELDDYERDTLYPLATRQIPLDLDDGVKVNYAKLGAALKKIPGLDAKDEE
jgi:type II restriction/modification system DNA methylase subunit YeeA